MPLTHIIMLLLLLSWCFCILLYIAISCHILPYIAMYCVLPLSYTSQFVPVHWYTLFDRSRSHGRPGRAAFAKLAVVLTHLQCHVLLAPHRQPSHHFVTGYFDHFFGWLLVLLLVFCYWFLVGYFVATNFWSFLGLPVAVKELVTRWLLLLVPSTST